VIKYQNTQQFCECQLVSIWNACRFWGSDWFVWGVDEQEIPRQFTKKYYAACDDANAVHGGVIGIDKQIKKYGIKAVRGKFTLKWFKSHLPIEVSVFCHRGYHSVLAVRVDHGDVILANYAFGRLHRMKWKRLLKIANKECAPCQYVMRKR